MKRKIVLLLLCVTVTLGIVGCEGRHQTEKQKKPKEQVTEQTVSEDTKISEEQEEEVTHTEKKTESVGEEVQNNNQVTETPKTPQKVQTETTEIEKKPENSNQKPENKPQSTKQPTVTQTPEKPKVEEVTPEPEPPRATANDCAAVANKVLEYINSYRSTPATKLPGLTKYAEYRSRQLIRNFAHDTFDERAAATALQYGTYIDPTLYGITGEPYYAAGAREAIAKAGYVGTIDYVAKSIADLVKNSAGHWAYVGSSEYPYIAVGVTYESDMWYCDIAMARENTDNK